MTPYQDNVYCADITAQESLREFTWFTQWM